MHRQMHRNQLEWDKRSKAKLRAETEDAYGTTCSFCGYSPAWLWTRYTRARLRSWGFPKELDGYPLLMLCCRCRCAIHRLRISYEEMHWLIARRRTEEKELMGKLRSLSTRQKSTSSLETGVRDGNTMQQAQAAHKLSYMDGRTTEGNVLNQAKPMTSTGNPEGRSKNPNDFSLGSLANKSVR